MSKIAFIWEDPNAITETFIRAQFESFGTSASIVSLKSIQSNNNLFSKIQAFGLTGIVSQKFQKTYLENRLITKYFLERFRELKPKVVFANFGPIGVEVLRACQILDLPLIVHFHGYDSSRFSTLIFHRDSYAKLFDYAASIIAVSRDMKKDLCNIGADKSKIEIIPCGVDCKYFSPNKLIKKENLILSVGRLTEKKAPELAIHSCIEVLKKFPTYRYEIVGMGPLYDKCQKLIKDNNMQEKIFLIGSKNQQQILEKYTSAKLFIQHSKIASDGDAEGTPVSIIEASACGLPVVSTKHKGIKEAVKDNTTGFLVDPGDVQSMSARIFDLLENEETAIQFGAQARAHVLEKYNSKTQLAKLQKLIDLQIK